MKLTETERKKSYCPPSVPY